MSTNQPPRRRRIAGERRRPAVAPSPEGSSAPTSAPPAPSAPPPAPAAPPATPSPGQPGSAAAAAPDTTARARKPWRERLRRGGPGSTAGATRVEEPDTTTDTTTGTTTGTRRWWGSQQSIVALAVALVVLLTLVVLGALGLLGNTGISEVQEAEDAEVAAESAPSVAERAATAVLAYNHERLDQDQDAAARFMTSSFEEKYADTFQKTVVPAARRYDADVTAEVRGSSVVRATDDRVLVLLFVDQTTRSTAHEQPQVALNRVEFEMVEQDGEWLVNDISSF